MPEKPSKPSPDFPLFAHATGKWAKKIRGKLHYFGKWADPAGARAEYEAFVAGPAVPKPQNKGLTVQAACNAFLTAKQAARDRNEIAHRSFLEYHRTCKRVVEHFGLETLVESLSPEDFQAYRTKRAQTCNIVAIGTEITRVRSIFRWCYDQRMIRERLHYGAEFKKASAKAQRRHRRLSGQKLFTAEQIRRLLDYSGLQMRAMILLGINCGFGPTDCATLPQEALDLKAGWVHYPRPKTEVDRHIPLWPETVDALKAVLARRYAPKPESEELVFVQPDGQPWDTSTNPIAKHFRQLYLWSGLKRGGHYWLRHTFRTVADETKDNPAAGAIMGHVDTNIAATYRERIDKSRLQAVVDHVRAWLFA